MPFQCNIVGFPSCLLIRGQRWEQNVISNKQCEKNKDKATVTNTVFGKLFIARWPVHILAQGYGLTNSFSKAATNLTAGDMDLQ